MAGRRRRISIDDEEETRVTMAPGQLVVPGMRLVRKIAEGGMGSVWEGEHMALKTSVAVKFVLSEFGDNEEAAARFEREATAAARIKSPHVVQVLNHGLTEDDVPFIVMELLEGEDLETRLKREPRLPVELVVHIVTQAAKGLDKAHSLGIIHRDIKPSNIFLTDVGGEVFVKLLDFGIAKLSMADIARTRVTQTGSVIGTPVFMAPEQMTHAKDAGAPADMWSLGVVAYLALTGALPYDSETIAGLAMAIERGTFTPASSLVEGLPTGIDAWFLRALAKDPTARFGSIRELAEELAKSSGLAPASTMLRTTAPGHTSTPPPPNTSAPASSAPQGPKPPGASHRTDPIRSDPPPSALAATVAGMPVAHAMSTHQTVMGSTREAARTEARTHGRKVMYAVGAAALACGAAAALVLTGQLDLARLSDPGPPASSATPPVTATASASAPAVETAVPSAVPAASSPQASSAAVSASAPSASASASIPKPTGKIPRPPGSFTAPPKPSVTAAPPPPKPPASALPKGPTPGAP
jgi:serine/threonine protein kinase